MIILKGNFLKGIPNPQNAKNFGDDRIINVFNMKSINTSTLYVKRKLVSFPLSTKDAGSFAFDHAVFSSCKIEQ